MKIVLYAAGLAIAYVLIYSAVTNTSVLGTFQSVVSAPNKKKKNG